MPCPKLRTTPNPLNTPVGSHSPILSPTLPAQPTATMQVVHLSSAPMAHFVAAIDSSHQLLATVPDNANDNYANDNYANDNYAD